MKLFKCDFIYARSFRNATGGARVQRNQNLNDPPPSIFASHNDWYNVACSLFRWWKLGLEQQSIRPNQFVLIFHRKKENRIIISTDLDLRTLMYVYRVKEK
jgi:hypothetical protein